MSYGLQSFDSQGRVQSDTTRGNDTGLVVVAAGTGTSVSGVSSSDLVFGNLSPSNGNIGFLATGPVSGGTVTFYGTATSQQGPLSSTVSANYLVCKFASSVNATGGDYGLRCINADGDAYYDTRMFTGNGGFGLVGYSDQLEHDGDTFAGGSGTGPSDNLITSTKTHYVLLSNTFVGTAGNNTGNKVKGRYIVFANNFSASYNSVEGKGYREGYVQNTYFNGTMNGIYFYRMRAGPQFSHIAHPNPNNIPYGAAT